MSCEKYDVLRTLGGAVTRCIVLGLILSSTTVYATVDTNGGCKDLTYSLGEYISNGAHIGIERYGPPNRSDLPAVIFVHGSAGVLSRPPGSEVPARDNFGEQQMACAGFVVFVPHYFESTAQVSATSRDIIDKNASIWVQALHDAIDYVLPSAPHGIVLFGESLGGYLSVLLGSLDDRIVAVSEFGGGIPPNTKVVRLPPMLIEHGEKDEVVPVSEAYKLRALAKDLRVCFRFHLYEGGHYVSNATQHKIVEHTIEFFQRNHCRSKQSDKDASTDVNVVSNKTWESRLYGQDLPFSMKYHRVPDCKAKPCLARSMDFHCSSEIQ